MTVAAVRMCRKLSVAAVLICNKIGVADVGSTEMRDGNKESGQNRKQD
jgi:hypothetical protein